jgi:hypothetical protein
MASRTRDGLTYDSLGVELDEIGRSRPYEWLSPQASKAPSQKSSLTGRFSIDDDQQSLVSHQGVCQSGLLPDKGRGNRESSSRCHRRRKYRFKSWKVGVVTAGMTTTIVLFVNISLTIWATVEFGLDNGIGTAYEGSCDVVSAWSFWLHILINGLSSMLLSASNYTMQCVAAPTRTECECAHARGDWLDIGVPSVRNLFKIRWKRRIMWALLAISSTPIHLLYNSAVFKTLDDNRYKRLLAGAEFLKSDYYVVPPMVQDNLYDVTLTMHKAYTSNTGSFENVSSKSCIETYATYYLSGHGNVLLITDDTAADVVPVVPYSYSNDLPSDSVETPFKWQVRPNSSTLGFTVLTTKQDVPKGRLQNPRGDKEAKHKSVVSERHNSQLLLVPDAGRALQAAILRADTCCRHHLQRHQVRRHVLRSLVPTRNHIHHLRRRNC